MVNWIEKKIAKEGRMYSLRCCRWALWQIVLQALTYLIRIQKT